MAKITAPFTIAEVQGLALWQASQSHPFTCAFFDPDDHPHDNPALVPTVRGWICPFCCYTQDWAHDFMCLPVLDDNDPMQPPYIEGNMSRIKATHIPMPYHKGDIVEHLAARRAIIAEWIESYKASTTYKNGWLSPDDVAILDRYHTASEALYCHLTGQPPIPEPEPIIVGLP